MQAPSSSIRTLPFPRPCLTFHGSPPRSLVPANSLVHDTAPPFPDSPSLVERNGHSYVARPPPNPGSGYRLSVRPDAGLELTGQLLPIAPPDRRPIVISGPSGVGKGTLYNLLFERHPDTFCLSVSHTTRAPRDGERHGHHYWFVPMADFEDLIAQNGFVEHAKFSGNRYGTSKMAIEEQTQKGRVVLLDIEMEVRWLARLARVETSC